MSDLHGRILSNTITQWENVALNISMGGQTANNTHLFVILKVDIYYQDAALRDIFAQRVI